jgi:hypothetical protein
VDANNSRVFNLLLDHVDVLGQTYSELEDTSTSIDGMRLTNVTHDIEAEEHDVQRHVQGLASVTPHTGEQRVNLGVHARLIDSHGFKMSAQIYTPDTQT